jgi:PKD repeat protein
MGDAAILSELSFTFDWGGGMPMTTGNGSAGTTQNHTYMSPGIYTITVTVCDHHGDGSVKSCVSNTFLVSCVPRCPPIYT